MVLCYSRHSIYSFPGSNRCRACNKAGNVYSIIFVCPLVYRGEFVSHLYGIHYHEINFLSVQKQYSAITLLDECRSGCFNGAYRRNIVSVYSYRRWTICRFPPIPEGDFPVFLVCRVVVAAVPGSPGNQETGLR